MASLRVLLGMVPSTSVYEQKEKEAREGYARLQDTENSDSLKRYLELDKIIHSAEFKNKAATIKNQKFSSTEAYRKEADFKKLAKDSEIKLYLKVKDSVSLRRFQDFSSSDTLKRYYALQRAVKEDAFLKQKQYLLLSPNKKFARSDEFKLQKQFDDMKKNPRYKNYFKFINHKNYQAFLKFNEQQVEDEQTLKSAEYKAYKKLRASSMYNDYAKLHDSDELEAYLELENELKSDRYRQRKNDILSLKYEGTPEHKTESEYLSLEKNSDLRFYFRFLESKEWKNYQKINDSEKLERYNALKAYLESAEFKKVKDYYALSANEKFEQSEEYATIEEHTAIKNSADITFYLKNKGSKKYDEAKKWALTFEDDFEGSSVNKDIWLTRYFWGDALLNDSYSLSTDRQYFSEDSLKVSDSILKITTSKSPARGKAWDSMLGFIEKEFSYTSGTINTGNTFRQKYGRFEAKIRFNSTKPVQHAFWMLSNKMVPHIDVARANKTMLFENFWKNGSEAIHKNIEKVGNGKYPKDFFIYTLIWTPEALEWKINGITVCKKTSGVPNEPMYVSFSSQLQDETDGQFLPVSLDIDWVRVFKSAK